MNTPGFANTARSRSLLVERKNKFGQPIGDTLDGWQGAPRPFPKTLAGSFCRLEPLSVDAHLEDFYRACSEDADGKLWTYMAVGPFQSIDDMRRWMVNICDADDPLFFAIVDTHTRRATGVASLMRIKPEVGVIEVGSITYSPGLQRTPAATEAMFLLMCEVFDVLGYRRYEWKCDSLNQASKSAAQRLGFSYEGLFRQALVYKGRNCDTAWYSILDSEWPRLKAAYQEWLNPVNFDQEGVQRHRLQDFFCITG